MSLVTRLCENKALMYSIIAVLVISIVALGYLAWKRSSSISTTEELETPESETDVSTNDKGEAENQNEIESEEELVEQEGEQEGEEDED